MKLGLKRSYQQIQDPHVKAESFMIPGLVSKSEIREFVVPLVEETLWPALCSGLDLDIQSMSWLPL